MTLLQKVVQMYQKLYHYRLTMREYPVYRIFERGVRIFVIGAVLAAVNYGVAHWTGTGFDNTFLWNAVLSAALLGGIDKLKNEWQAIRREYSLSVPENFLRLFQKDSNFC